MTYTILDHIPTYPSRESMTSKMVTDLPTEATDRFLFFQGIEKKAEACTIMEKILPMDGNTPNLVLGLTLSLDTTVCKTGLHNGGIC